jgi:hypothetical protein
MMPVPLEVTVVIPLNVIMLYIGTIVGGGFGILAIVHRKSDTGIKYLVLISVLGLVIAAAAYANIVM